jgi:hypothetical protein
MWVVNRSSRTLIKKYLIHARMVRRHSALLEFNLSLPTGWLQQVTCYKGTCMGTGIQSSWIIVLSMLFQILGMVVLQGCLLGGQGIKTPMFIS